MRESILEFIDRQNRKVARFGREAEAAAQEAYRKSIRLGQDLKLSSPGDVIRHGAQLLQDAEDRAARIASRKAEEVKAQAREALRGVPKNSPARSVAIDSARTAGNVAGVVRGGVHAVDGVADGITFLGRLIDPLDHLKSAPRQSAAEQLGGGVVNAGRVGVDYVRKGVADPQSVVTDVTNAAGRWRRKLDPSATAVAPTFEGELRRNFNIGQNQGELAFGVGSLFVGGPAAKLVKGFSRAANLGNDAKYLAQGFSPRAAAHLAKPYPVANMGSHFVPRRTRLPKILGGGPLPRSYMDGPFNKLIPPGISRGDLYELHYEVDPRFYGTSVRGERWSGKDLGLNRHGMAGQLWYGSPAPLKARVTGLGAGAGSALYSIGDKEEDR